VAVKQFGRRIVQEREEQALGVGAVQRLLEGGPRSTRVAERVAGDRLEQGRLDIPQVGVLQRRRTVQDGREHGRRRLRVVLREPQRRLGDAYLAPLPAPSTRPRCTAC
jgi:hypothetical protein